MWKCPGEKTATGCGVHREIQHQGARLRIGLQASKPQLLSPWAVSAEAPEPCRMYSAAGEATSMRSPRITARDATKESPHTSKKAQCSKK